VNDQENNPGNPNDPPGPTTAVPEPITALLLGIGICLDHRIDCYEKEAEKLKDVSKKAESNVYY
jgi:hypothetical protein